MNKNVLSMPFQVLWELLHESGEQAMLWLHFPAQIETDEWMDDELLASYLQ